MSLEKTSENRSPTAALKHGVYKAALSAASYFSGGRRPMGPDAEGVHPPRTRNPLYNESLYFNFFDQENEAGGFIWIGKLPNQRTVNSVLVLFEPGGDVLALFANAPYPSHSDAVCCGPMAYDVLEPLKKWRIRSSGDMVRVQNKEDGYDSETFFALPGGSDWVPVSLDLTFTGSGLVHNAKDYNAASIAGQMVDKRFGLMDLAGVRKIAANHYEQVGRYEGRITVGGKDYAVRATGHRDHSWGVRDWYAPKAWTWITAQFGDEAAFNLCRIMVGKIDLFMGFTHRRGVISPLETAFLETFFEPDGVTQKQIHFVLRDKAGFTMDVTGRAGRLIRLSRGDGTRRVVVTEAFTRYEWEGRQAWGISEYLKKIA